MKVNALIFIILFSLQSVSSQDYKVVVYEDSYIELDTFESIILEDGNHIGWNKRFALNFNFPYYDTSYNYIIGDYESTYSFDDEIDYSIRLMLFGYEFDKLTDLNNVSSDLRYALKLKDEKKALCLQYTNNRLTSDPSVQQFNSYINFQIWFIENGDIEVRFGDYNLDHSPVYVPGDGFYIQTVNAGPILIGPEFGLYHPYVENIKFGIDGPYDSLQVINGSGYLTVLPPPNWVIKFEKQSTAVSDVKINETCFYPNPVMDKIKFTEPVQDIYLFNMEGKLLKSIVNSENCINEFNLSEFASGIYILKVLANGKFTTTKIIKT